VSPYSETVTSNAPRRVERPQADCAGQLISIATGRERIGLEPDHCMFPAVPPDAKIGFAPPFCLMNKFQILSKTREGTSKVSWERQARV